MNNNMICDISIINSLTKQFLCYTTLNKIDFMISDEYKDYLTNLDIQKQILDQTVNNDLVKQYPIKTSYQKAFLKLLMQKIEESNGEIHDDLYIAYCRLILLPDEEIESMHYRHFLIENKSLLNCITLKESTNLISNGTTGLCSWQGAMVLSKWCTENIEQFYGKNVLELGCGIGLTGISIISTCFPKQYVFSDCHCTVLNVLCENMKLNLMSNKQCELNMCNITSKLKLQVKYEQTDIQVIDLNWKNIDKYTQKSLQPDIIIAADILYDSDSFDILILGLKHLLTTYNHAIFAATVRNKDTIVQFFKHLESHNLVFEECILPKWTISIQSINSPVQIFKIFLKVLH